MGSIYRRYIQILYICFDDDENWRWSFTFLCDTILSTKYYNLILLVTIFAKFGFNQHVWIFLCGNCYDYLIYVKIIVIDKLLLDNDDFGTQQLWNNYNKATQKFLQGNYIGCLLFDHFRTRPLFHIVMDRRLCLNKQHEEWQLNRMVITLYTKI